MTILKIFRLKMNIRSGSRAARDKCSTNSQSELSRVGVCITISNQRDVGTQNSDEDRAKT